MYLYYIVASMKPALKCYVIEMAPSNAPKHYYVGVTTDVDKRIREHVNGQGAAWTKHIVNTHKLRVVHLVELFDEVHPLTEDTVVKKYMLQAGIPYVRGGSYSQIVLPQDTIKHLLREFGTATGACFRCGGTGHYANMCVYDPHADTNAMANTENTWLSGFTTVISHATSAINAVTGLVAASHGHAHVPVSAPEPTKAPQRNSSSHACICTRCGRNNHTAVKCCATTHYNGTKL